MGVERAVTRWYIQRQMILNEITQLERQVAEMREAQAALTREADSELPGKQEATDVQVSSVEESSEITRVVLSSEELSWDLLSVRVSQRISLDRDPASRDAAPAENAPALEAEDEPEPLVLQQLRQARAKLDALGPCPKPMMG